MLAHLTFAVAVALTPPSTGRLSPDSMMVELRNGGYTILWRHASTDYSTKDAPGFPDDRTQQRNLTEQGALDAALIGEIFKRRGVPIGDVFTSQMYRTRETAERAFGRFRIDTLLLRLEPSDAERRLILAMPANGTNRVLVTHHFIIERNAPGIRPGDVAEGEAVVVRSNGETLETVALFKMADWRRLAEATPGMTLTLNSLITRTRAGSPNAGRPAAPPPPPSSSPLVLPSALEGARYSSVAEYLRVFNTGEPDRMRKFYETSVIMNLDRTMEQRLETFARLRGDLGNLSIASAEAGGDTVVVVNVNGSTGKPASITFTLEPPPGNRLAQITLRYAVTGQHP